MLFRSKIFGGPGNDILTAAAGNTLAGGTGDDKYFIPDVGALAKLTITEQPNEGSDTLDLSQLGDNLVVSLKPNAGTGAEGLEVTAGGSSFAVKNIETVKAGVGKNTYFFYDNWGYAPADAANSTLLTTIDESVNQSAPKATLDFSKVTLDLTFLVKEGGHVEVTSAPQRIDGKIYTFKATTIGGVANLIGGKGNNVYTFDPTATNGAPLSTFPELLKKLTLSPAGQPDDKTNILDYSAASVSLAANVGATAIQHSPAVEFLSVVDAASVTLPVREAWTFTTDALSGVLMVRGIGTSFDVRFSDTSGSTGNTGEPVAEQTFKKGLESLLKRSDFTVSKRVETAAGSAPAKKTIWTVEFSSPGPVAGFDQVYVDIAKSAFEVEKAKLENSIKTGLGSFPEVHSSSIALTPAAGANAYSLTYQSRDETLPFAVAVGSDALGQATLSAATARATYQQAISLPSNWNGDTFRLKFKGNRVNDGSGNAILIHKDKAAAEIVGALQQFVDGAATSGGKLHEPATVTGDGTAASPWVVSLVSCDTNRPELAKDDDVAASGTLTATDSYEIGRAHV